MAYKQTFCFGKFPIISIFEYIEFIMDTIVVNQENKTQLKPSSTLKAAIEGEEIFPEHVLAGIKLAINQAASGLLKPYNGIRQMLEE